MSQKQVVTLAVCMIFLPSGLLLFLFGFLFLLLFVKFLFPLKNQLLLHRKKEMKALFTFIVIFWKKGLVYFLNHHVLKQIFLKNIMYIKKNVHIF